MSDLMERLQNRQRAKVESRQENTPNNDSSSESLRPENIIPQNSPVKESINKYIEFEMSQATLRIEKNISDQINKLCNGDSSFGRISRESLIEAMFIELERNPDKKNRILKLAKERSEFRKKAGIWKRGQSMQDNASR